ncbi:hypothetical protein CFAM422_000786 [Trichoderma lentiforme]|uniref:Uncharacterized protein n=1 Tax=Trichoderma lentiforme TaxID=1567552 RepID=A0A9P5CJ28_9HYPO|nr:hypothetical protein CFAM422_000786 [Trichoderma lentiforme]
MRHGHDTIRYDTASEPPPVVMAWHDSAVTAASDDSRDGFQPTIIQSTSIAISSKLRSTASLLSNRRANKLPSSMSVGSAITSPEPAHI